VVSRFSSKRTTGSRDLIARLNPGIEVSIQTNGTILNDEVKQAIERLRATINISVDALDPANYERIRVNAKFEL
jgi:MoaA/NifB/PqqE/SkfB family radical SAM enzyme